MKQFKETHDVNIQPTWLFFLFLFISRIVANEEVTHLAVTNNPADEQRWDFTWIKHFDTCNKDYKEQASALQSLCLDGEWQALDTALQQGYLDNFDEHESAFAWLVPIFETTDCFAAIQPYLTEQWLQKFRFSNSPFYVAIRNKNPELIAYFIQRFEPALDGEKLGSYFTTFFAKISDDHQIGKKNDAIARITKKIITALEPAHHELIVALRNDLYIIYLKHGAPVNEHNTIFCEKMRGYKSPSTQFYFHEHFLRMLDSFEKFPKIITPSVSLAEFRTLSTQLESALAINGLSDRYRDLLLKGLRYYRYYLRYLNGEITPPLEELLDVLTMSYRYDEAIAYLQNATNTNTHLSVADTGDYLSILRLIRKNTFSYQQIADDNTLQRRFVKYPLFTSTHLNTEARDNQHYVIYENIIIDQLQDLAKSPELKSAIEVYLHERTDTLLTAAWYQAATFIQALIPHDDVTLNPVHADICAKLAIYHLELGDVSTTREYHRRAALLGAYDLPYNNLLYLQEVAQTHALHGNHQKAVETLENALNKYQGSARQILEDSIRVYRSNPEHESQEVSFEVLLFLSEWSTEIGLLLILSLAYTFLTKQRILKLLHITPEHYSETYQARISANLELTNELSKLFEPYMKAKSSDSLNRLFASLSSIDLPINIRYAIDTFLSSVTLTNGQLKWVDTTTLLPKRAVQPAQHDIFKNYVQTYKKLLNALLNMMRSTLKANKLDSEFTADALLSEFLWITQTQIFATNRIMLPQLDINAANQAFNRCFTPVTRRLNAVVATGSSIPKVLQSPKTIDQDQTTTTSVDPSVQFEQLIASHDSRSHNVFAIEATSRLYERTGLIMKEYGPCKASCQAVLNAIDSMHELAAKEGELLEKINQIIAAQSTADSSFRALAKLSRELTNARHAFSNLDHSLPDLVKDRDAVLARIDKQKQSHQIPEAPVKEAPKRAPRKKQPPKAKQAPKHPGRKQVPQLVLPTTGIVGDAAYAISNFRDNADVATMHTALIHMQEVSSAQSGLGEVLAAVFANENNQQKLLRYADSQEMLQQIYLDANINSILRFFNALHELYRGADWFPPYAHAAEVEAIRHNMAHRAHLLYQYADNFMAQVERIESYFLPIVGQLVQGITPRLEQVYPLENSLLITQIHENAVNNDERSRLLALRTACQRLMDYKIVAMHLLDKVNKFRDKDVTLLHCAIRGIVPMIAEHMKFLPHIKFKLRDDFIIDRNVEVHEPTYIEHVDLFNRCEDAESIIAVCDKRLNRGLSASSFFVPQGQLPRENAGTHKNQVALKPL